MYDRLNSIRDKLGRLPNDLVVLFFNRLVYLREKGDEKIPELLEIVRRQLLCRGIDISCIDMGDSLDDEFVVVLKELKLFRIDELSLQEVKLHACLWMIFDDRLQYFQELEIRYIRKGLISFKIDDDEDCTLTITSNQLVTWKFTSELYN